MPDINFEAVKKERRERIRWFLLRALDTTRPEGGNLQYLVDVVGTVYQDVTDREIKRELDYLAERGLIELKIDPIGAWSAKLDRFGVDVVEYTVECDPGIARPRLGA